MVSPARPASTVILARPGAPGGVEIFMVRRPVRSEFAADVYVFPGGAVRPDDADPTAEAACAPFNPGDALRLLSERGGTSPADPREALGFWVAALRELFEEAGVLLAEPLPGVPRPAPDARAARLDAARRELQAGGRALAALAGAEGVRLACEQLIFFSHWVTPREFPRRYDTRFFLAAMPHGQEALHCAVETVEGLWISPAAALERFERGEFPLVFVTQRHLERLAGCPSLEAALAFARSKAVVSVNPGLYQETQEPFIPSDLEGRW
jgi:8-oxo-dGTP pyrophosphatase MutT (NUDIX family)